MSMRDATGRIVSAIVDEQDIHEFDNLAPWYDGRDALGAARPPRRGARRAGARHRPQNAGARDGSGEGTRLSRPSAFWWRRCNIPAQRSYAKLNYEVCGECSEWEGRLALLRKAADRLKIPKTARFQTYKERGEHHPCTCAPRNGRSRSWPSARISPTNPKPSAATGGSSLNRIEPLYLELGCGKGVSTAAMVKDNPHINYVAMDITCNVLGDTRRNIEKAFDGRAG